MQKLIERIRVVLTAAPTYLLSASVVVAILADELAKDLPPGWQDNAVQIGGAIVAALTGIVSIIRRVTPVLEHERGLLVPPDKRG